MFGLPWKNISTGHKILSLTASKNDLDLGGRSLNVVRDTLLCYG